MDDAYTILIVDDEEPIRELLISEFADSGFHSFGAENGRKALEVLAAFHKATGRPVDAVLSDVKMPQMCGDELYEATKKLFPEIPFFFMTGHASTNAEDLAVKHRLKVFHKPFRMKDVVDEIQHTIVSERSVGASCPV